MSRLLPFFHHHSAFDNKGIIIINLYSSTFSPSLPNTHSESTHTLLLFYEKASYLFNVLEQLPNIRNHSEVLFHWKLVVDYLQSSIFNCILVMAERNSQDSPKMFFFLGEIQAYIYIYIILDHGCFFTTYEKKIFILRQKKVLYLICK